MAAQLPVLAGVVAHPRLLGGYLFSLLTCLLMLAASAAVGSFVLRRFVKPFPEGAEMLLTGTGLGLALFFYLIPLVAIESCTAVNDLALTFYVLLNLL